MRNRYWLKLLALLMAFGVVAAACGDDDDDAGTDTDTTASTDGETDADTDTTASTDGDDMEEGDGDAMDDGDGDEMAGGLAAHCPATLIIQTDWFPESEHGALYHLLGDDYSIASGDKRVSGSMVIDGEDQGIDVEIRAGGPAIGTGNVAAEMYVDDSIHIGYATTDGQILRYEDTPLLSVMAPLEINPQIIYWDPETYPDFETLADLGEAGVTINVFGGGTFSDVFVAQGLWTEDQVDPSYDGSPARFVASGDIAQQGFASAEVWIYKNQVEEYGRDLAFQSLHDAGFPVYSQTLSIRPDDLETMRPCLTDLIPAIQRATVDYYANPDETNAVIVETVAEFDTFWTYPAELADFSVATQLELGLAGNGPDDIVGNIIESRVQEVIDALAAAEMDFPAEITPADIFTNEFIDESIGF